MNAQSTRRCSTGTAASYRSFAGLAHPTGRRLGMLAQAGVNDRENSPGVIAGIPQALGVRF